MHDREIGDADGNHGFDDIANAIYTDFPGGTPGATSLIFFTAEASGAVFGISGTRTASS